MASEIQSQIESEHKLAAIMFTDIVGYTKMMGRDEEKGLALVRKNREIHKPLIAKFHGTWIKEMGDGVLAQFDSAYNAARCAIEIQKKAKSELNGKLRIGLHIGEIIIENKDIFGDGVNVASRIESVTEPGGVFITDAFFNALKNRTDIQTKYLGEVLLKNVDEPVKIYCIVEKDLAIPAPERIKLLRQGRKHENYSFRKFFKQPVFYLLIILFLISLFVLRNLNLIQSERTVKALAVLPFANLTGSEEEQYFVDGLHDAVIGEISKIGNLIVRSRTSTLQFRDTKLTMPEIAKILDVDALLETTVSKTGDSIYMQVQLIKARPVEDHIWNQDYIRDTRHIFSLYGDLAKTVAREIEVQVTPFEDKRLTEKKEVDPEAYRAYLNGQFHWNKLTNEDLDLAEKYFEKAIQIDPDYAEAYLGLSSIGGGRAIMGLISNEEARLQRNKFLDKALELDSGLWEAHYMLAGYATWGLWDFKKGLKEFETAILLNPNDAKTRVYYAQALCVSLNDYDRAIKEGARAVKIAPLNNLIKGLFGQTLNFCRKYEQAEKIFKEVLDSDPYNSIALSNIKTTYHMQKKYTQAFEYWKTDNRNDSLAVKALELGYKTGGYQGALKALAGYSIQKSSTKFVTPWRIFTIYVRTGMKEESLDWMEKAYEIHDPNMPAINTDPIFDYLRDEPRFQAIVNKMNFPEN